MYCVVIIKYYMHTKKGGIVLYIGNNSMYGYVKEIKMYIMYRVRMYVSYTVNTIIYSLVNILLYTYIYVYFIYYYMAI